MSRMVKMIAALVVLLLLVIGIGAYGMFRPFIKAANSITQQEEHLYSMEYTGDYGFDQFLERGGASSDQEVADFLTEYLSHGLIHNDSKAETGNFGCSAVCVKQSDGSVLFGRNYDWEQCETMIVHTKPVNGYESVSTCCLDFLGFGEGYHPDQSMMERMQSIAAIYVPLDGMNEMGLMVADLMAGDSETTHQNTDKADLTTTTAIRLLLDHAADTNEAIALLKEYDMNSSIDSAHHLFIADRSGNSIVAEYVNNELIVTETDILTNHYLADGEKQGIGSQQSHLRFDILSEYQREDGMDCVKEMLKSAAQYNFPQSEGSYEKTMWSIVYDPEGLCSDFWFEENYDHSYGLLLKEKGVFIKK